MYGTEYDKDKYLLNCDSPGWRPKPTPRINFLPFKLSGVNIVFPVKNFRFRKTTQDIWCGIDELRAIDRCCRS